MGSLLPSSSEPLALTVSDAGANRLDPIALDLAVYWDPQTCPEDALPFLAHALGLPIWEESWSTVKKRAVLAEWPEIAGKLGTEDAIRWAAGIADAPIVMITVPPQGFYLAGLPEENEELWHEWLRSLPEIRLLTIRNQEIEGGYLGELDFPDELAMPGMFLGDEHDVPTFFAGTPPTVEKAVVIRSGVETPIEFERVPDPRWKRIGDVVNFFWPGQAGAGLFLDDVDSVDQFADGAPAIKLYASVSFGFGTGGGWPLISPVDRVQDVTPKLGTLYDNDGVGVYADDFWVNQFLDEVDPLRATYYSFRIMETLADWQPPGSYLGFDRFGMDAHTAEIMCLLPGVASQFTMICGASFLNDAYALEDPEFRDIDLLSRAVAATRSHRDDIYLDFDIPFGTNLNRLQRLADLTL